MSRFSMVITSMFLASFLFSCSPQQGGLNNPNNNDRVSEFVINDLTSNRWCQLNSAATSVDYTWTFTKEFKATSLDINAHVLTFDWSITNDNILSFYEPDTRAAIFTKKVSYNYNVASHKRTMRWIDPQAQQTCNSQGLCSIDSADTINFVECE